MRRLYKYLPLFLQDIAVTIKNNHSYYQKYGAIPFVNPLKKIINQNNVFINDSFVVDRVNKLIKEAIENTEYYRANSHNYPFISSLDDLKKLPILKKTTFKENNSSFISKKATFINSYSFKTSGSTGTPLFGKIKLSELRKRFLVVLASQKLHNIDYSKRVARFPGANIGDKKRVYRRDYINNHFLFSIYNISHENISKYYNAISKFKIQILEGYPSTIYSLVKLFKVMGYEISCVEKVMTTAEQLMDFQKIEIEEYFKCSVFDFYGSSEGSTYMFLNEMGQYVNCNTTGFIEVVDEKYHPVKSGEFGRMLVTSFNSEFTPLIRYDIGDYCSLLNDNNYITDPLLITKIGGRKEDVFITEEGVHFTRFSLCLKFLPEYIIESQLILTQYSKNILVRFTSPQRNFQRNEFKPFEEKFESMLGTGYSFNYEHVKQFDKSARGKLSAVKIIENEKG